MRRFISGTVLFLLIAGPALADTIVIAPSDPMLQGQTVDIQVVFTNPGKDAVDVTVLGAIEYRVAGPDKPFKGTLNLIKRSDAGIYSLEPGSFIQHTYQMTVPQQWSWTGSAPDAAQ
ncbi:MAG: hypothetical protein P8L66_12100 [Rhodospirillaceae bacterium]|nr:hypothetical protein [Rhodospirillaceae bacterium]